MRTTPLHVAAALAAAASLAGCPPEPQVAISGGALYADGDLNSFPGLAVVANMDDDNTDGTPDWEERGAAEGDDDRAWLYVEPTAFEGLKKDEFLRLEMGGQASRARVYIEGVQVLGEQEGDDLLSFDLSPTEATQEFAVEFERPLAQATLSLRRLDGDGEEVESDTIWMTASPLILNHHLQQTEHVWVMDVNGGGGFSNQQMVGVFEDVLGDQFTGFPAPDYDYDVWIQDEVQFATYYGPGEQRIDLVIDSIRDRGLDDWPEDRFEGEAEWLIGTWGPDGFANSLDSFGNLEISPPLTDSDGVFYPNGRVYWGGDDFRHPTEELTDFLASQQIQAPIRIDTTWLCVGHIDEYTSFVPDPSSEKGWKFVYADTRAAWDIIEGMDQSTDLPRYDSAYGYGDVAELASSNAVRFLNEDTQEDILDPVLDQLRDDFGLTDDDIMMMPSLFEDVGGCGQAALIPGMANLIVANRDEQIDVFLADPFFRDSFSAETGQEGDAMIQAVIDAMPEEIDFHFVDNWNVYHLGLGEVHCGTNSTRTPVDKWWRDGGHLLERLD